MGIPNFVQSAAQSLRTKVSESFDGQIRENASIALQSNDTKIDIFIIFQARTRKLWFKQGI